MDKQQQQQHHRRLTQRSLVESKKYKKKVQMLLKPHFPIKKFAFHPDVCGLLFKQYQKWVEARQMWFTNKLDSQLRFQKGMRLSLLRAESKWYHLIQPHVNLHLL